MHLPQQLNYITFKEKEIYSPNNTKDFTVSNHNGGNKRGLGILELYCAIILLKCESQRHFEHLKQSALVHIQSGGNYYSS